MYHFSNFLARTFGLGTTYGNMRNLLELVMKTKGENDIDASIRKHKTTINNVNATIYTSFKHSEEKVRPILIYYHGGGYVISL
jgi:acetyl esterase/lipase